MIFLVLLRLQPHTAFPGTLHRQPSITGVHIKQDRTDISSSIFVNNTQSGSSQTSAASINSLLSEPRPLQGDSTTLQAVVVNHL